jgi:hypothetical protein
MDPITILAALAPLGVDLGKALVRKFVGTDTFTPQNIDEYVKLKSFDLELFKAMNFSNGTGTTYPWVEAVVRLQRPVLAGVVLLTWAFAHATKQVDTVSIDNFAAAVGFYIFGDRTLFYARKVGQ